MDGLPCPDRIPLRPLPPCPIPNRQRAHRPSLFLLCSELQMPLLRLLALLKFTTAGWLRDEEPAARTPVKFRRERTFQRGGTDEFMFASFCNSFDTHPAPGDVDNERIWLWNKLSAHTIPPWCTRQLKGVSFRTARTRRQARWARWNNKHLSAIGIFSTRMYR